MKKSLISSLIILMSGVTYANTSIPNTKSQFKVTANVAAGCDLSADNINFGVLSMPLKDTFANSNIVVQCSKNASYSIGISYSGTSVSSNTGTYTYAFKSVSPNGNQKDYYLYKDGILVSQAWAFYCDNNTLKVSRITFNDEPLLREAFNFGNQFFEEGNYLIYQGANFCNYGNVNDQLFNTIMKNSSLGVLRGITSSENIKYYLEVPDSQNIWSIENKYTTVGIGENQSIPMKAIIKSSDNPTHRMTPDTYTSTISVILTY